MYAAYLWFCGLYITSVTLRDDLSSLLTHAAPWYVLHVNSSVLGKLDYSFIFINLILVIVCLKSQLPPGV